MNTERLLKLADLLEADAKNKKGIKFDLGLWGFSDDGPASISCGTSACAVGLAVLSGAFKSDGLTNYYGDLSGRICPSFDDVDGFEAVERLFNISNLEANFLFLDENYPSNKTTGAVGERFVAKRIRDFVAGKAKPQVVA
jgi:hypothetical protein